jgi:hypothetical protein
VTECLRRQSGFKMWPVCVNVCRSPTSRRRPGIRQSSCSRCLTKLEFRYRKEWQNVSIWTWRPDIFLERIFAEDDPGLPPDLRHGGKQSPTFSEEMKRPQKPRALHGSLRLEMDMVMVSQPRRTNADLNDIKTKGQISKPPGVLGCSLHYDPAKREPYVHGRQVQSTRLRVRIGQTARSRNERRGDRNLSDNQKRRTEAVNCVGG